MFLRPACPRAVQHRTRPFSDSIWISEELLFETYQRFYVSKLYKRHGSFVPGPMECRRRLGRRRMAYALDQPTSSPTQRISALWNWLFREIDSSKWKWEAPESFVERSTVSDSIRKAGDSHANVPEIMVRTNPIELSKYSESGDYSLLDEVERICVTIETGNERESWKSCCKLSRSLRQNLVLGLMTESNIRVALKTLIRSLNSGKLPLESSNRLCLLLLEAIWEGMTSCSVLPLAEVSGKLLKDFLWEFHRLPPSLKWQHLIHRVIHSVTADQLASMRAPICLVVHKWRESWIEEAVSTSYVQVSESSILKARDAVSDSASRVLGASQMCGHVAEDPKKADSLVAAQLAIREAQASIFSSLTAITKAENTIITQRASVLALVAVLRALPSPLLHHILWSCTVKLCGRILPSGDHWKKHYWLSLIAQLPGVDNRLFVELWREMDTHTESLEPYLCVEPVLDHWASQGHSPNHLLIKNTLEITHCGHLDFGSLLFAISKHKDLTWTKTLSLFSLLGALKKYRLVPRILQRIRQLGITIPKNIYRNSIETMVSFDTQKALQLCVHGRIPLWTCPKLVIAMVRNPLISSDDIWRRLRLPRRRLQPQVIVKSPIWWDVKSLLVKIIIEFAYSEHRSQKVVFRNVYRYIRYLQLHRMPVTPDVSRALTHVGLTRRMTSGKFIREQTLRYVLRVVTRAEGIVIAAEVEEAVHEWNRQIIKQQDWDHQQYQLARREMNVLCVGPID